MLGKLPFVLGYGVYCQNGGSEKIFFQFLTSCKKCLDAGKECCRLPCFFTWAEIGNILKKEIINFPKKENYNDKIKKISILVLGGSQAAKVFAEVLPEIFKYFYPFLFA